MAKQKLVGEMRLESSESCFVSIGQAHRSKEHVSGGLGIRGGWCWRAGWIIGRVGWVIGRFGRGGHRVKRTDVASVMFNGFREGTETVNVVGYLLLASLATVQKAGEHRTHGCRSVAGFFELLHDRSDLFDQPNAVVVLSSGLVPWEGFNLRLQGLTTLPPCHGVQSSQIGLQGLGLGDVLFDFLFEDELFQFVVLVDDGFGLRDRWQNGWCAE